MILVNSTIKSRGSGYPVLLNIYSVDSNEKIKNISYHKKLSYSFIAEKSEKLKFCFYTYNLEAKIKLLIATGINANDY